MEKMQELVDSINDRKADIQDMMNILTQRPMEEENDHIKADLHKDIDDDNKKVSERLTTMLPYVPTNAVSTPAAAEAENPEEDELLASLAGL